MLNFTDMPNQCMKDPTIVGAHARFSTGCRCKQDAIMCILCADSAGAEMQVVSVGMPLLTQLSAVRARIPPDLRSADARRSVLLGVQVGGACGGGGGGCAQASEHPQHNEVLEQAGNRMCWCMHLG